MYISVGGLDLSCVVELGGGRDVVKAVVLLFAISSFLTFHLNFNLSLFLPRVLFVFEEFILEGNVIFCIAIARLLVKTLRV